MINIYGKNNTNYNTNGDATLIPIRADLTITLNGSWQLEVEVPYDKEKRYELVEEGAVIICDVGCIRELANTRQRFRIYDYKKGISSVTAIAFPVAMESTHDAPIDNLVISGKTGVQAMAQIQAKTSKYTLYSDITRTGSTSFANTNVNNAIASGSEGCFIDIWGGEIVYDNLKFSVLNRVGNNEQNKHKIIYGKNITDISYEKDDSGLITRIYPISSDGIRLNGSGYVDSPKVSQYPIVHSRYMSAPYKLIEDDIASSTATAQLTRSIKSQITTLASSLSHSVYNTAVASKVEPEYIRKIKADILSAVQSMATATIYNADANKVMQSAIKDGMEWLKDVSKPEWTWHDAGNDAWWYGASESSRAVSEYVYVDRIWRYFGDNAYWQRPKDDDSKKWDWIQEASGKRYGNKDKYYAQKTYVYITMNGQMKEYWFDDDGYWDGSDDTDSSYAWHGSGTSADPWWFGEDGATSEDTNKFLHGGWWFIDGTYYYFDEHGYYDGTTKFENYQWDWVKASNSKWWFGNDANRNFARVYVTNQWLKVGGDWYRFDANGYAVGDTALENEVVARFTTGMAQLKTLCESLYTQAYNLLYSQMRSYCTKVFNTGVDIPSVKITVNMADLSNTTEYEQYRNLEKVYLGDSVTALDYKHGISAVERIVSITYDCIRKVNSEVEIGVASSSLSDILKTEAGGSVAGGFDTSVIESTLTSHTNELARLDSVKQNKLTAGENITIVNDVISATGGGGSNIYYGTDEPSASLGSDKDYYCQLSDDPQTIIGTPVAYGSMDTPSITEQSFNEFSAMISGIPTAYLYPREDEVEIPLENLIEGNTYTFSFDYQFDSGTRFFNTHNDGLSINGEHILFEEDTQVHSYSITFTAQETNILVFGYHTVYDNVHFSSHLTNGRITGVFKSIINVWVKVGNLWIKDAFGSALRAGDNIQISNGVISATDTNAIEDLTDVELDNLSNGQVLTYNSTTQKWENADESGGSEVEANPSDPATDTLNTIGIDGTVYNIAGGGGGGNALIVDAQIYSEDEQVVGVWTDNKPLYQKTVAVGTLPNTTTKTVAHNISNIAFIAKVYGTAYSSTNGYTLPLEDTDADAGISGVIRVFANSTNIFISTKRDQSEYDVCFVTLQYTKTTDVAGSGGYQAYGFTPVIYSTEEREIGVWTNNKPLYEKTVFYNNAMTYRTWVRVVNETDITIVDHEGVIYLDGEPYCEIDYYRGADSSEYVCSAMANKSVIQIYQSFSGLTVTCRVTYRYTKDSDVAGSGSYNTIGVPTVHYTTDEQVIGTWIDGKPLYEKTFTGLSQATNGVDWVTVQGVNIPSIKDLINATAWASGGTGEQIKITLAECSAVNDGVRVNVISSAWNRTINKMTVQYTKTTD